MTEESNDPMLDEEFESADQDVLSSSASLNFTVSYHTDLHLAWRTFEESEFQIYDYESRKPFTINLPNDDNTFLDSDHKVVLLVPKNEENPYLVQVPDPQY